MAAIGLIEKDKNNLIYKGDSNFGAEERVSNENLKNKITESKSTINRKQHELLNVCLEVKFNFNLFRTFSLENWLTRIKTITKENSLLIN